MMSLEPLFEASVLEKLFALACAVVAAMAITGCGLTSDGIMTTGYREAMNETLRIRASLIENGVALENHSLDDKRALRAILERK
jgi:hypothetical protein